MQPFCKNGHDRRDVGVVKNGTRVTCAACRADQVAKKRKGGAHGTETHCPAGHEYTPENTYLRPRGGRECRTCIGERNRIAYYQKSGRDCPAEKVRRRGSPTTCPQGHDTTDPANVGTIERRGRTEQVCRQCRREINRRSYERRKAATTEA